MKSHKKQALALSTSVLIGKYEKSKVHVTLLRAEYAQAFSALRATNEQLKVVPGVDGHPRLVSGLSVRPSLSTEAIADPEKQVRRLAYGYVVSSKTRALFAMKGVKLLFAGIFPLPHDAGFKVVYQQVARAKGQSRTWVPIHGAQFEMLIAKGQSGTFEIQKVISTIVRSKRPRALDFAVSAKQARQYAITALVERLGGSVDFRNAKAKSCLAQANLVKGRLRPSYRLKFKLGNHDRPYPVEVIVDGQSGNVVFARELAYGSTNIAGQSLVNVADRNEPIANQIRNVAIDSSLLAKRNGQYVLANKWIRVVFNQNPAGGPRDWEPVPAMPDSDTKNGGTFNWAEETRQFKGVVLYWSYVDVIQLLSECGLEISGKPPIECRAEDEWNPAATFYPDEWLIQVGVGDGKSMLAHIVYDLVVINHEFGHVCVYFLRPVEHYLPGPLGQALNEAIADMFATLIRYNNWYQYSLELLAKPQDSDEELLAGVLTYDRFMSDMGGIGTYCWGGNGFRFLNNFLVYPQDLQPENKVHDNARIPGAAMFHMLQAWVKKSVEDLVSSQGMDREQAFQLVMPQIVRQFLKLIIAAIPILPGNRITFSDWREALEDRDNQLFAGAHHAFIAQGFDQHGIKVEHAMLEL